MVHLIIENVPEEVVKALGTLAEKKGMSISQYALYCLALGVPKRMAMDFPEAVRLARKKALPNA